MKFDTKSSFLDEDAIKKIEDAYRCTYVFESCIKDKSGHWANMPCAIFYCQEKHPVGSHYMAMFLNSDGKHLSVADGISATEDFNGLKIGDQIIFSRYRHDFRDYAGQYVDGGRDYFKFGARSGETGADFDTFKQVRIKVNKDKLEIINA